jgi:cytochrome c oxidase cbb3-type subunit 4
VDIDINTLRGLSTVLVMVAFLGVCAWAYSGKRKKMFEEAANLPFADEQDQLRDVNQHE